jgi:hypothetical protein
VDRHRPLPHLVGPLGHVDHELGLVRQVRDDQAIGEDGFQLQHPQRAVHEQHRIDAQVPHSPMERRDGGGVVVEQCLLALGRPLEMLRGEEHPLVPLQGGRHIRGGRGHAPLAADGRLGSIGGDIIRDHCSSSSSISDCPRISRKGRCGSIVAR